MYFHSWFVDCSRPHLEWKAGPFIGRLLRLPWVLLLPHLLCCPLYWTSPQKNPLSVSSQLRLTECSLVDFPGGLEALLNIRAFGRNASPTMDAQEWEVERRRRNREPFVGGTIKIQSRKYAWNCPRKFPGGMLSTCSKHRTNADRN